MTISRRQFLKGALVAPVAASLAPLIPLLSEAEEVVPIASPEINPVIIGTVRRAYTQLMVYDIMGIQPMTAPTGEIFTMRAIRHDEQT